MKSYLFSLFSRFFLAFSGFAVFIVTAALYGANGRGTIGYGTSLFAVISLILSLNLGRAFLGKTKQDMRSKETLIGTFLLLNLFLSLISGLAGIIFWKFSLVAQQILTAKQVLLLSLTSIFYIWSVNGNSFYASFILTRIQERIILLTRFLLLVFLGFLYFFKERSIDNFFTGYATILFLGAFCELTTLFLYSNRQITFNLKTIIAIINEAKFHHVDYLTFNLFPLLLTLLLASYEEKSIVGKFNFTLQLVNLIFLFSTTANIRISSYVADVGFQARLSQYRKLLWATLAISSAGTIGLYGILIFLTSIQHFAQFEGVQSLFLVAIMAIPGYLFYQFFSPIWIDLRKQKLAAAIHSCNLIVFALISPSILKLFGVNGAVWLIVLFHFGLVLSQYVLFRIVFPGKSILHFMTPMRGQHSEVDAPQNVI